MAVETSSPSAPRRRWLIGGNVAAALVLAATVVVFAQLIAFKAPRRWDMTSSGVNSLSEGSENLLRGLDQNVRLTSLYFETDREEEDQPQYRRTVRDLIGLYEATNRSKVRSEWVNPLKDHEKYRSLTARLREKKTFKDQIAAYQERVDRYTQELGNDIPALVQSELDKVATLHTAMIGPANSASADAPLPRIEQALSQLSSGLEQTREQIDALALADNPQYTRATSALQSLYSQLSQSLKNIGQYSSQQAQVNPNLTPEQVEFLSRAGGRYADLVTKLEEEVAKLQALEPLSFDELIAQLEPTGNALLVETDKDARVVDFESVWPAVQGGGGRAGFANRAFKGEEKLTSAILRATHKQQTAVVFVRYGGRPLFMGGFMPGQPKSAYARMKQ